MKKIFSVFLALLISAVFMGTHSLVQVNAEGEDATLYIHIFQFDGDYTNTGVGIWDGLAWNNFEDTVSSTDGFGAVISKTYTAAQLADASLMSSIEVKPSSNGDNSANYLAPGDGKVYADISALISGSETELHVYYVEGADGFLTLEYAKGTVVLYMDPAITVDPATYDGWGMHVWNRGTGVPNINWTPDSNGELGPWPFTETATVTAGQYDIPMMLSIVPVGADAYPEMGFIVHNGDTKAYPNDLSIPSATDGPVNIVFYIRGMDSTLLDASTFLADAETEYVAGLVNRFMGGTVITDPQTVTVEMFQPKTPFEIVDRLWIEDAQEAIVAITGFDFGDVLTLGGTSDVTIASQSHLTFYLQLPLTADVTDVTNDYAAVGSFQGWDISGTLAAPLDSFVLDGYTWLIFELTTFDPTIEFKVLFDAEGAFDWSDAQVAKVGDGNVVVDFAGASTATYKFYSTTETMTNVLYAGAEQAYTYTAITPTNNLLTVFLPLDESILEVGDTYEVGNIGMVGSIQTPNAWTPAEAIHPTEIITVGSTQVAVFQVDTDMTTAEYKVLYSGADDVFDWDHQENELIKNNVPVDFTDTTSIVHDFSIVNYGYVDTIAVENVFWLSIYMENNYADYSVGIVGALNGWDINNPILPKTDAFGNLFFDLGVSSRTGEFKIFIDKNDDGFDWGDAVTGNDNIAYDLGTANQGVLYFTEDETNVFVKQVIGEDLSGITTKYVTLAFADDTFADVRGEYTVYFVETPGTDLVDEFVIDYALAYQTENGFVVPAESSDFNATYALTPTQVEVLLNGVNSMDSFQIFDELGTAVAVTSIVPLYAMGDYTATVTPAAGEHLVTLYLHTDREYTNISQFGIVGAVQSWTGTDYSGAQWDISNTIAPKGVDSNGNIVFEFVLGDSADSLGFKIVFDPEGDGFAWDGNECTPSDVKIVPNADITLLFADGNSVPGNNAFTVTLTNPLSADHDYETLIVDAKGFSVYAPLYVDNSAPDAYFTVKPGVAFTVEKGTTFDILNYYTIFKFVDGRDGEIAYTVDHAVDTNVLGAQQFIISATDTYGNTTSVTLTFTVVDTTAPNLGVMGPNVFEVGSAEPTWAYYAQTNEGTVVVDASQVDMNTVGEFYVRWTATDASGNVTTKSLKITIVDTTDPVLTVSGDQEFTVGDAVPNWASYATTNEGTVTVDASAVDFTAAGTYTVTWTATDASGNAATASLDITVVAAEEVPATGCTWFNAISLLSFGLVAVSAFVVVRKKY